MSETPIGDSILGPEDPAPDALPDDPGTYEAPAAEDPPPLLNDDADDPLDDIPDGEDDGDTELDDDDEVPEP